ESNGLTVTQTPTLIQIAGPPPEPTNRQTAQQQAQTDLVRQLQQQQAQQMQLFTYRLRHASAVDLAPVLTNLFSGFGSTAAGRGGTVTFPNGNGGFTTINTGVPNVNIPAPAAPANPLINQNPGGGRGGGRGAVGGGGG